jgi:hypothetical protein
MKRTSVSMGCSDNCVLNANRAEFSLENTSRRMRQMPSHLEVGLMKKPEGKQSRYGSQAYTCVHSKV